MSEPETPHSPVLPLSEAARYVGRTANALKVMRHRRRGPRGFLQEGRLMYFQADLDAWLHQGAQSDPRWAREHDPALRAPETKRARRASARKRPASTGAPATKAA